METTKKTNKTLKIIKISLLSIFYTVVVVLVLFSLATLARKKEDDIPNLFGYGFLAVETDSMDTPEGSTHNYKKTIKKGDLVIVKVLNDKSRAKLDLEELAEEKAIVTFYGAITSTAKKDFNTHRVVEYRGDIDKIATRGDKYLSNDDEYLSKGAILAVYAGKIKGFGNFVAYLQTEKGFAFVVVLPVLLLVLWQLYVLVRRIFEVKEIKLKESLASGRDEERERIKKELEAEERERIRQELLAEMAKENKKEE